MSLVMFPGAVIVEDEQSRVRHVLKVGEHCRFGRPDHKSLQSRSFPIDVALRQKEVSRVNHLTIEYTVRHNVACLQFCDCSLTGTYIRFDDAERGRSLHTLKGSDCFTGLSSYMFPLNVFLPPRNTKFSLGCLHSETYFKISSADALFFEACMTSNTSKALQYWYGWNMSLCAYFTPDRKEKLITQSIQTCNSDILKLVLNMWPFHRVSMANLTLAIQSAPVSIFSTLWNHGTTRFTFKFSRKMALLNTAAQWNHIHVISYLGHSYNVAARDSNLLAFQTQTNNVSTQLALELFAGQHPNSSRLDRKCNAVKTIAFWCTQQLMPSHVRTAISRGKWPACAEYCCDSCSCLVHAMQESPSALCKEIAEEFYEQYVYTTRNWLNQTRCRDHFFLELPGDVIEQYIAPYLEHVVVTRGFFNCNNFKWFPYSAVKAVLCFLCIQHRCHNQLSKLMQTESATDSLSFEPLPTELQMHVLSFLNHADWHSVVYML